MGLYSDIFTEDRLTTLFPPARTDLFFEALFGEAEEGSYDIILQYRGGVVDKLDFALQLAERPGKCLACNLTYGLPQVFSRHPVINIRGLAEDVAEAVGRKLADWRLGATQEIDKMLHSIPFSVELD